MQRNAKPICQQEQEVWPFDPRTKHRRGATPREATTHIAIAEALDGKPVIWVEKVSEKGYLAADDKGDGGDPLRRPGSRLPPQASGLRPEISALRGDDPYRKVKG